MLDEEELYWVDLHLNQNKRQVGSVWYNIKVCLSLNDNNQLQYALYAHKKHKIFHSVYSCSIITL